MIPTNLLNRGRELWLDHLDGILSPSDAPELNHLLKTYPDLRREAARLAIVDAQLRILAREEPELFGVPEEFASVSSLARLRRAIGQAALIPKRRLLCAVAAAVVCL